MIFGKVDSTRQLSRNSHSFYDYNFWLCSCAFYGEEPPPCDPKRKALLQKEQSKAISMLVAMETKDSLRRGAIMVVTKKIGLTHADLLYHKTKKLFY